MLRTCKLGALLASALGAVAAHGATTLFVQRTLTTGNNDGTSWEHAYRGPLALQAALSASQPGDEIWVAAGTYAPAASGGPLTATFQMKAGLQLLGGFAGTETLATQRDPSLHVTTLSGDLDANPLTPGNVHHVVTSTGLNPPGVIDGFTVTGGDASQPGSQFVGGGILVDGGSAIIRRCTLVGNTAATGAGIGALSADLLVESCSFPPNSAQAGFGIGSYSGQLSVSDCHFTGNYPATGGSAGLGIWCGKLQPADPSPSLSVSHSFFSIPSPEFSCPAGIAIAGSVSEASIVETDFIGNTGCGSGAMQLEGTVQIDRCRFIGNEGMFDGGAAIHSFHGHYTVSNSLFLANDRLGFSTIFAGDSLTLINCTLADNGDTAFVIAGGGTHRVIHAPQAAVTASNCIIWGNKSIDGESQAVIRSLFGPVPRFDFCLVQHWDELSASLVGSHSFASDPMFRSVTGPDGIPGTPDDDLRLSPHSPAIDRGSNDAMPAALGLDLEGLARRREDSATPDFTPSAAPQIDLGAYEFVPTCPCDLNADSTVDDADFVIFAGFYNTLLMPGPFHGADFNGDSVCDDADFVTFATAYNELLCP